LHIWNVFYNFAFEIKQTTIMINEFSKVQELAKRFLAIAEEHNEGVSAFLDGSLRTKDAIAYTIVKDAYRAFIKAYNAYYEESHDDALDYELAESVNY